MSRATIRMPHWTSTQTTGARESIHRGVDAFLTPLDVGAAEKRERRFVAELLRLMALGASFKEAHDVIYADLPYGRVGDAELRLLIADLEPWGWSYDDEDERFETFFAGG